MSADDGLPSPSASGILDLEDAYRSYHAPLLSFLSRRLPERSVAADIAQTVFAALAARPSHPSIREVRPYLFRAARNQLAEYYRSQERGFESAERIAADPSFASEKHEPSPEEEAIRRDKLNRLRAIIDAMPEKRRRVFLLARFQELTESEIAARLGMTREAVRQHVSRAMRDCQREMRLIFDEAPVDGEHAGNRNGQAERRRRQRDL